MSATPARRAPAALEARLRSREEIAAGTMAFRFDKPPGLAFKAGQAVDLVLPGTGGQPLRHTFSPASAPFEEQLEIATRMRASDYKRTLAALPLGAAVAIEGPSGSLPLHNDRSRAAVLLAGGIGITPFMSMLRQAARDPQPRQIALLYSNRRPEDAAYLEELLRLARNDGRFRLVATMTQMAQSARPWHGQTRPIDAAMVAAAAEGLPAPIYYVAGPPAMVDAMRGLLGEAGIDDDDIRSEDFYGY